MTAAANVFDASGYRFVKRQRKAVKQLLINFVEDFVECAENEGLAEEMS
jgi:hypothetical protein